MQENPEIKHIIESSVKIAQNFGHEYVTTEHLLLSLVRHVPFKKCLDAFGVEVDQMDTEIEHYLVSQLNLISDSIDTQPRRTLRWNVFLIVPMYRLCLQVAEPLPQLTCT